MGEFIIRPGTLDDVEQRVDLYMDVAAEGRWIGGEPPLDRDELIERRKATVDDPRFGVWVAEVDGSIVGELVLQRSRGRADLGMEIASAWRGRGVGAALVHAGLAWAREQGLDKVALQVWPHNERALKLYEKFGFAREGYHPRHYRRKSGEAWDIISMGLVLRED